MMIHPEIDRIDHEVQTSLEYLNPESRQKLEKELQKLREDKDLLEGKIKGYLTLSDICQEYKEELTALRQEYNKLQDKVNMTSQVHSNESPTPDDDQRTGTGHEKECSIKSSTHHSFATDSNNVASSILQDKDKPIKTRELYGSLDDNMISSGGSKSMPHSQELQDKFPMQESFGPESFSGLGFEHVGKSPDVKFVQSAGITRSGDLMKFSITPQQEPNEQQIEEILKSVQIEGSHVMEMKKVISVVKSYADVENQKLKNCNEILVEENNKFKLEKSALMKRIQQLECQLYDLSNPSSRQESPRDLTNGWVHVQKSEPGPSVQKQVDPLRQTVSTSEEIQILKQNNEQLKEANQRWSSEWNKLQQHYDIRISELQTERDKLTKEITDFKISEDTRVKDYEKMLLNSKRKANEEENAKEEAYLQLHTANNKLEALQTQLEQAQDTVDILTREKHAVESEISILRQRPVGMAGGVPALTNELRSTSELKIENDVLRQQLLVFQEDFDRERSDRAKAQSTKDEYKKQNEQLKKRARQVEQKNTSLERQVKTIEDNNRKLMDDKSANMQEISTLKIQLQREREKAMVPSQNGYQPPLIQSAGLQQPRQQFMFGQPVQRPMQYRMPPTYDQQRVPQLNGVVNVIGSQYPQTSPPGTYYQANQAGKQTEYRAGAWTCGQCTYVNYPGRTVCEMCGYIQNATSDQNSQTRQSGNETLHPRGEHLHQQQQQQQQNQPQFQQPMFGQFVATNRGPYQQPP